MKHIFAHNLAGFEVFFVPDPTLEKGRAKMFVHPEDYKMLYEKFEVEDTTTKK